MGALFRRWQDKSPWIWKLQVDRTTSIWNKKLCSLALTFSRPLCAWWMKVRFKGFSRGMASQKKKEESARVNALSGFKSPMRPNLALKGGDVLIWKPESNSCMLTWASSGRWKDNVDEHEGPWVSPQEGISMRKERTNKILSQVQSTRSFMQIERKCKSNGLVFAPFHTFE